MRHCDGYSPAWLQRQRDPSGGAAVLRECARQHTDILHTVEDNAATAATIAERLRQAGEVTLLGMGASHHANHIAATRFRAAGIRATAMPASEAVYAAPPAPGPVILTSQSGGSAEVVKWLERNGTQRVAAGITLNTGHPYGADVPTLTAAGGAEQAFAATRSFTLTLAAYAAVLRALGAGDDDAMPAAEPPIHPDANRAVDHLGRARAFVVSGRAAFDGMAGMMALSLMELGRIPALALEGGQFRHGPVEMLSPEVGVILFRADGPSAAAWDSIADIYTRADAPTVVFDASGEAPLPGTVTLDFTPGGGLNALYRLAPTEQAVVLGLAAARVDNVGQPLYCAKVTDTE